MADRNFPTDFFEGELYEKKGRKSRFLNKYSTQRVLPYIRVPVEYTVILGIVILILVVISYAVGVEKGKRISSAEKTYILAKKPQLHEDKELTEMGQAEKTPEVEEAAAPLPPSREITAKAEETGTTAEKALYSLQLASFKKEKYAKKEVENLRKTGKDASYTRKGLWYQVFVKGYETIEAARNAKDALIQEYPDCYIRKQK